MPKFFAIFAFLLIHCCTLQAQSLLRAFQMGDWQGQSCTAVHCAANGDVIVGGYASGRPDFDPGPGVTKLDSNLSNMGFVARYDSTGNLVWVGQFQGGYSNVTEIVEDPLGNLYFAGNFNGSIDIDPGAGVHILTAWGTSACFLLKLDAGGNFIWAGHIHAITSAIPTSLRWDGTDGLVVGGTFQGDCDLDPADATVDLHTAPSTSRAGFVSSITSDGVFRWGRVIGAGTFLDLLDLAVDGPNNLIRITGILEDLADLDPGPGTANFSSPWPTPFLTSWTLDSGQYVSAFTLLGTTSAHGDQVEVDGSGNFYLLGSFFGDIDVNPGPAALNFTSQGVTDLFLSKFNAAGTLQWSRYLGGTQNDEAIDLCVDAYDRAHVLVKTQGLVDVTDPSGTLTLPVGTPTGYRSHIVASYDDAGSLLFAGAAGGMVGAFPASLDVRNDGVVLIGGEFRGGVDLDPSPALVTYTSINHPTLPVVYPDLFVSWWKPDACGVFSVHTDSLAHASCSGAGYIGTSPVLGTSPFTYAWSTGATSPDISPSTSGLYTVTVTDGAGCSRATTYMIEAPEPGAPDLEVAMSSTILRAGFPATVSVFGRNKSCIPANGDLQLVLSPFITVTSVTPTPTYAAGDTLRWSFTGLNWDDGWFTTQVDFICDTSLTAGFPICFDMVMSPVAGDAHPIDNVEYSHCHHIVSPCDPNIVSVWPSGECTDLRVDKDVPLTYTVEFQNTGTADAINVVVMDTLDPALDIGTLRVLTSSDSMIHEILAGNIIRFTFPDINLPDSTSDEPGSHGWFGYEIKPYAATPSGTEVSAKVAIYFDFEAAVITPEVMITLVDSVLPCSSVAVDPSVESAGLAVFPNPASDQVTLRADQPILSCEVHNLMGQTVSARAFAGNARQQTLDVSKLPKGMYLVRVRTTAGESVQRLQVID